jgi:hypothetical protein
MVSKVLSNLVMPVLVVVVIALFYSSVKSAFSLPTVYRSSLTQECVRATDSRGHKLPCKQAEKGKYFEVLI